MNLRTLFLTLSLTIVASAMTAYAQGPRKLQYLTPADVDPSRLLPPPPADGTPAQELDMAALKKLLKDRTPERFKQAQWDNEHEDGAEFDVFRPAIGPEFDPKKLPATAKLVAAVENDQKVAATEAKAYFNRIFAAVLDPSLVPLNCDPADVTAAAAQPGGRKHASYPSGHGTMGYTFGTVLAALMPEKSQAILARAQDYAYSRMVCGDHYRGDIEASHALGNAVGIALLKNAALQPLIEASKVELRAAHLTM
jgi:acid phosphatase (class A)